MRDKFRNLCSPPTTRGALFFCQIDSLSEKSPRSPDEPSRILCFVLGDGAAKSAARNLHFKVTWKKNFLKMFIACIRKASWHIRRGTGWLMAMRLCTMVNHMRWTLCVLLGWIRHVCKWSPDVHQRTHRWRGSCARKKIINRSHNSCSDFSAPH